jgi:hypothetical protein
VAKVSKFLFQSAILGDTYIDLNEQYPHREAGLCQVHRFLYCLQFVVTHKVPEYPEIVCESLKENFSRWIGT